MKNLFSKKLLILGILVLIFAPIIMPETVSAQSDGSDGGSWLDTLRSLDPLNASYKLGQNIGEGVINPASLVTGPLEFFLTHVARPVAAFILAMSALLFEASIRFSIADFKSIADGMPGIVVAWGVMRDIANIFFIFILLYAAIGTILGLNGINMKETIIKVIMVSLLINFSLPITRVIIDSGNALALYFYNEATSVPDSREHVPLNQKIVNGLKVTTLTGISTTDFDTFDPGGLGAEPEIIKPPGKEITSTDLFIRSLGGLTVIMITAFVFMAGAILFALRIITLIILMVFSSLAFALMVFPKAKSYVPSEAVNFWGTLIKQTFFAPVYMLMLLAVIMILDRSEGDPSAFFEQSAAVSLGSFKVGQVLFFVIISGLLIASLVIANSMGARGSSALLKKGKSWGKKLSGNYGKNLAGWAGRNTFGLGAYYAANSKFVRGIAGKSTLANKLVLKNLDSVANASFGGEKGYKDAREGAVKQREKEVERIATNQVTGDRDPNLYKQAAESTGRFFGRQASLPFSATRAAQKKLGKQSDREFRKQGYIEKTPGVWETEDEYKKRREQEKKDAKKAQELQLEDINKALDKKFKDYGNQLDHEERIKLSNEIEKLEKRKERVEKQLKLVDEEDKK